jgi:hypothetical protein
LQTEERGKKGCSRHGFSARIVPKRLVFEAKSGFFWGFSGVKSHHAGEFGSEKFSTGIDFKRVINNLQGFERNLYPYGL